MKRRFRLIGTILIVALVLAAAGIVTVRLLMPQPDAAFVDFMEMKRSATGSDALACAPGLCAAKVDLVLAPVPVSAAELAAKIKALPEAEPRTALVAANDAELRYVLVQRSAVLNFTDTINIAIQPLDASHAALAIYSQSQGGAGDVHRQRLQRWLDLLGVAVVG